MAREHKLTEEQKAAIKDAHDAGVPYTALAVQYRVSNATIMRACRPDYYEKQKAANRKYQAKNVKRINDARKELYRNYRLALHVENDAEVIEQLDKKENVTGYIRQLVLRDMKTDAVKE